MRLYKLAYACCLYNCLTKNDAAVWKFQADLKELSPANPVLDLSLSDHGLVLLKWLNAWGCRHIATNAHKQIAQLLATWWSKYGTALSNLRCRDPSIIGPAYDCLKKCQIPGEPHFGSVAAAKTLHAVQPDLLSPWDGAIQQHFVPDDSSQSYCCFLQKVEQEVKNLQNDACRLNVQKIAQAVGHPNCSLVKLVDEYFWVTITRKCTTPTPETLRTWVSWLP